MPTAGRAVREQAARSPGARPRHAGSTASRAKMLQKDGAASSNLRTTPRHCASRWTAPDHTRILRAATRAPSRCEQHRGHVARQWRGGLQGPWTRREGIRRGWVGVHLGWVTANGGAPTGTVVEEREPASGGAKTVRDREREAGAHVAGREMGEMSDMGALEAMAGGPHRKRRRLPKPPARKCRLGRGAHAGEVRLGRAGGSSAGPRGAKSAQDKRGEREKGGS
jgi:hypothetical protein